MPVETNGPEFAEAFRRYASFAHSVTGPAFLARESVKMAKLLYVETRKVAPTISDIAADVIKRGWSIPARFDDGRLGRGTPDQWVNSALQSGLPRRRGRKSKKRLALEESIRQAPPTLGQMQAFVIKHRSAHIGYVASGWASGVVEIQVTGDSEFDITNPRPGMAYVDARHGVVKKAFDDRTEDMLGWIQDQFDNIQQAA
jgi:hypothetical protein